MESADIWKNIHQVKVFPNVTRENLRDKKWIFKAFQKSLLQVMMKISESIASVVIDNDLASIFTSLLINILIITHSKINHQTQVVPSSTYQILMITIIQILMAKTWMDFLVNVNQVNFTLLYKLWRYWFKN